MTGQNDWQDESLTGQVRDQAGHCPLTGRYFQPCFRLSEFHYFLPIYKAHKNGLQSTLSKTNTFGTGTKCPS